MKFQTRGGGRRQARETRSFDPIDSAPEAPLGFAASPLVAPMHGAFYLDDDLLRGQGLELETLRDRTVRAREALRGVRQRDGAFALARLGGSEPDLKAPPRREGSR
jgi:hypothetical protein